MEGVGIRVSCRRTRQSAGDGHGVRSGAWGFLRQGGWGRGRARARACAGATAAMASRVAPRRVRWPARRLREYDPDGPAHEERGEGERRARAAAELAREATERVDELLGTRSQLEREDADIFRRHDEGKGRVVRWTPATLRAALHNAIGVHASVADVATCVSTGASLEWRDEDRSACGMTCLHLATCSGAGVSARLGMVGYLLAQGVSVDATDLADSTALHCAAAAGEPQCVSLLLKAGARPSEADAELLTPLHLAANNGHAAVVTMLADNWADVDAVDYGDGDADADLEERMRATGATQEEINTARRLGFKRAVPAGASLYVARRGTPLHVAAAADRLGVARALLAAGARADHAGGPHGSTPLHIACRCGHVEVAEELAAAGANIDARDEGGDTPLMRAVEGRHTELVRWLLQLGADARATNDAGLTPLHVAAAVGASGCFGDLAQAGADVHARTPAQRADGDGGRAPVHYAAHYARPNCVEAFDELLALGANPLMRSLAGGQAARQAKERDGDEGELVSTWDHDSAGWPALFYAIESKTIPLVAKLCEIHAKRYGPDECPTVSGGRTPHMLAAIHDAPRTLAALVEAWPSAVHRADSRGRTALHYAATFGARRTFKVRAWGGRAWGQGAEGWVCACGYSRRIVQTCCARSG